MTNENRNELKSLIHGVPSGLLVDDSWLEREGHSPVLVNHCVRDGWLENPTQGVYRMPGGNLMWEQVVISLQSMMRIPVAVGGLTALQMNDFSENYVDSRELREVRLYGHDSLPDWVFKIPCEVRFIFHDARRLFPDQAPCQEPLDLHSGMEGMRNYVQNVMSKTGLRHRPWMENDWPIKVSTQERAVVEALDESSNPEAVSAAEIFIEGAHLFNTENMNGVLDRCANARVKKRFLTLARRHNHGWFEDIDTGANGSRNGGKQATAKLRKGARQDAHPLAVDAHPLAVVDEPKR